MRNAESLVKIQVADISSDLTRITQTDLSIKVGAIHINLTTMVVDDLTHCLDMRFKYSKCTRVCDHDSCKLIFVLLALLLEIIDVKIARCGVTFQRYHFH